MTIEILYKEIATLYGDQGNIDLLKSCLKDANFIYTTLSDVPHFVNNKVDLIMMGPASESDQIKIIEALLPYKKEIKKEIKNNTHFLLTGNAIDIFGKYIINNDNKRIKGLEIFDFYVRQDLWHRYNGFFIGKYNGYDIVGHKSQFSMIYNSKEKDAFLKANRGIGFNKETKFEGIHINNFYATTLLGPFLVLNPHFLKELLISLKVTDEKIPFIDDLLEAYNVRVNEFNDEKIIQID